MSGPLTVKEVDLHAFENATAHHTERFENVHDDEPTPVLRRGQRFTLTIKLADRPYDRDNDVVRIIFSFGSSPRVTKGTQGLLVLSPKKQTAPDGDSWTVKLLGTDDNDVSPSIKVEVTAPAGCPVGKWKLQVRTRQAGDSSGQILDYTFPKDVYILFNPWVKEDQVYMETPHYLDEYVLNDVGKVWVGPWGGSRGREWVFGQFDACVLPATMLMMDRSPVKPMRRGDPVLVTRAISKMVNSNDDQGILTGLWDGKYEGGTPPAAWTGSVPILQEYLDTGREVKYGQCWVFAAVVTTVCRALGIPSRVVSNLVSAHDANESLTVDRYYDKDNEPLDEDPFNPYYGDMDSIWNYHVWNDVWMARPDLPAGYGGWQAVDATPQELSGDSFQCGPASLEAIRCGAVGMNYDVGFMLASVNADLMRWKEDEECDLGYANILCNKYHIGRMILTKQPFIYDPNGDKDRQEITSEYKYHEGTKAERLALMNAVSKVDRAKRFYAIPTKSREDVEFTLVDLDKVFIGENFSVTVNIHNKSSSPRTVEAVLSAASVYYTGVRAHLIKKATGEFLVQPNAKEMLRLVVKADEYLDKLVEYCQMKIFAIATVKDTRETWADEDDFEVTRPPLQMKVDGQPVVNRVSTLTFSFTNPIKKKLTSCQLRYESPGLVKATIVPYRDIGPKEEVKLQHRFTPVKPGDHKLVGTFSSKELVDITGSAAFEVVDGEE